jgi:hypothetical protein
MRAPLAFYVAHHAQRKPDPLDRPAAEPTRVEKLAGRIVAGCVTVLVVLAAAVALPMPTGG